MIGYDIHQEKGERFRVLHTTDRTQIATMTLPPGQTDASEDGHPHSDQIACVIEGRAELLVGDDRRELRAGEVVVIPQGTGYRLRTVGRRPCTVLCVYGPPAYPAEEGAGKAESPFSQPFQQFRKDPGAE